MANTSPKRPNKYLSKRMSLSGAGGTLHFHVTPRLSESRTATFVNAGVPSYFPVVVYTVSNGRTFNMSGNFLSRTEKEARETYVHLALLKSWVLPETDTQERGVAAVSPARLKFKGWGTLFSGLEVSLQSYNIQYPDDVDYIPDTAGAHLPIILPFSIVLIENPSKAHRDTFDLNKYRVGNLEGF